MENQKILKVDTDCIKNWVSHMQTIKIWMISSWSAIKQTIDTYIKRLEQIGFPEVLETKFDRNDNQFRDFRRKWGRRDLKLLSQIHISLEICMPQRNDELIVKISNDITSLDLQTRSTSLKVPKKAGQWQSSQHYLLLWYHQCSIATFNSHQEQFAVLLFHELSSQGFVTSGLQSWNRTDLHTCKWL